MIINDVEEQTLMFHSYSKDEAWVFPIVLIHTNYTGINFILTNWKWMIYKSICNVHSREDMYTKMVSSKSFYDFIRLYPKTEDAIQYFKDDFKENQ